MSWSSGSFTSEYLVSYFNDNSNQTQEISQIGQQNDDMQFSMGGQGQGQGSLNATEDNSNQTQEISQIGEQNVVKETVGLDLGSRSSNKKQKKLRSDVWNHFEKRTDENGKEWAICNICKKLYYGSSKMGTTHLKNHYKSCGKKKSNEGGGSASGDKPAENSVMDQQLNCSVPSISMAISMHIRSGKLTPQQAALVAQKFNMRSGMIGGPQSSIAGMSGPRQQMLPGSAGLSSMLAQNLNQANMNPLQRTTMGPMGPMGLPKLIPGINHYMNQQQQQQQIQQLQQIQLQQQQQIQQLQQQIQQLQQSQQTQPQQL